MGQGGGYGGGDSIRAMLVEFKERTRVTTY